MAAASAAVFLIAIAQSIFEAFPISSSMHLKLMGLTSNLEQLFHLQAAIVFSIVCWPFIKHTLRDFKKQLRLVCKLIIIVLPTIMVGFLIRHNPPQASPIICNLIAATFMLLANMLPQKRSISSTSPPACLAIGIIISLALIPGVSRMGITFTTLRLFQFRRFDALFFTLLIGIPITAGACVFSLHKLDYTTIVALLMGAPITLICLKLTFRALKFWWIFGVYRIVFSLLHFFI